VDSQEDHLRELCGVNSFDGNPATFWHTQWCPSAPSLPHEIQINFGATYNISGSNIYRVRRLFFTAGFLSTSFT